MNINFTNEDWARVRQTYEKWWNGELNRPIMAVISDSGETEMKEPNSPILTQANCNNFSISPKDIILRYEYEFSKYSFFGDSFPMVDLSVFGAGILAAFMGAKVDNSMGHMRFFKSENQPPLKELHFEYDKNNLWVKRINETVEAGMDRWQGNVLFGLPDIGGVADILVSFLTNEGLIYAIYDEPDEVKRLIDEINIAFFDYFKDFSALNESDKYGYSNWTKLLSMKKSAVLQSDFSYMISPEHFKEFVLPELSLSCQKLDRSIYHMDGSGQIPHLDMLLGIKELDVIQWVPNHSQEDCDLWQDIYKRISDSGKKIQFIKGHLSEIDKIIKATNNPSIIHRQQFVMPKSMVKQELDYLSRWGIS